MYGQGGGLLIYVYKPKPHMAGFAFFTVIVYCHLAVLEGRKKKREMNERRFFFKKKDDIKKKEPQTWREPPVLFFFFIWLLVQLASGLCSYSDELGAWV
jgi:hypothetical protein